MMEQVGILNGNYITILRSLFQARKLIAQKWISVHAPTVEEWRIQIRENLLKEKYVFMHRDCLGTFESIWRRGLVDFGPDMKESL